MRAAALKGALAALAAGAALLLPAAPAGAEAKPAWGARVAALPSSFTPGSSGNGFSGPVYLIAATNLGAAPAIGPIELKDTLPAGVNPVGSPPSGCAYTAPVLDCTFAGPLAPGKTISLKVVVSVEAGASGTLASEVAVQSPGAAPASMAIQTAVGPPPPFGFLDGFRAPLGQEDGVEAGKGGSRPYLLSAEMTFPTEKPLANLGGSGHLREASVDFAPGEMIDPAATPELCTEKELTSQGDPGCPPESQVGTIAITTVPAAGPEFQVSPLYNMVPPPGQAASVGFDALGVGIFVHLSGRLRSESDYGLTGGAVDALALTLHPVFGAQIQLWGDPSDPSHDKSRGACLRSEADDSCPVDQGTESLLRLPTFCPGGLLESVAHASSWEQPEQVEEAAWEGREVGECDQERFDPSIEARPTTNRADSPAGLEFHLRQATGMGLGEEAAADLRDASLTLPEGLVVNPAAANGQGVCSSAQIGMTTAVGESPPHFSATGPACPNASKLGTLEALTPLLAQFDATNGEVKLDPESGKPIPRPVGGSVYLAKPFDNPFGSLLAIYLVVEDPLSGTVAKIAAKVDPDPDSGQITSVVADNPQLPLTDVHLSLFGGDRGSLRTPPACASYTSRAELVPYSTPADTASVSDSFAIAGSPDGGPCPASPQAAPHHPAFAAGTLEPVAGAYSPLVARLAREDGSQPLAGFEVTLPRGLVAKLAGVPYCPEDAIARAIARSHPEEGAAELTDPSCPAGARIGSLDAGAGAGPNPVYTHGSLYLAGPYKGAPLSVVAITPALAGPFDLGVVVVRTALSLDPDSARARAVSDPFPQILDGIPLDLRSVSLRVDRPGFTLNPTSCDPMSVDGAAISAFGASAALSSPFQVGGCRSLPYRPKLGARLFGPTHRGSHPSLRAVFRQKPGEAGTARISFALPRSEFIDQGHFRTICTRVQFAAHQCPAGSVYGHVRAFTPLLDYPLEGPVYLRSSSHELPDLVLALRGPPSQPLELDLDGRVDSIRGGIRTIFESVPDAPVSKAIVTMRGGRKGLFQNSTNLCKGTHRLTLSLIGQNGTAARSRPPLRAQCGHHAKKAKRGD